MKRALIALLIAAPAIANSEQQATGAAVAAAGQAVEESGQPTFDMAVFEACYLSHGTDCVGVAAKHCMITNTGGSSNVVGTWCLDQEYQQWDAALNRIYTDLKAAEEAHEGDKTGKGFSRPPTVQPLINMQRAWIVYRDALCQEYEAGQWGGGSGTTGGVTTCLMEETARQVRLLDDYLLRNSP